MQQITHFYSFADVLKKPNNINKLNSQYVFGTDIA